MKKLFAAILVIVSLIMVSCGSVAQPLNLDEQSWVTPGKVTATNVKVGSSFSYDFRVHMGNHVTTRDIQVGTEESETSVNFTLTNPLFNGLSGVKVITSDLPTDALVVSAYDPAVQMLTIKGFTPAATRVIHLEYQSGAQWEIYTKEPFSVTEGYTYPPPNAMSWITISQTSVFLNPYDTKTITVTLNIPQNVGTVIPPKWEFWVGTHEVSTATIQTELAIKWLISMKG